MEKTDLKAQLLSLMDCGVYLNEEELLGICEEMECECSHHNRREIVFTLFSGAEETEKKKILYAALNQSIGKKVETYSVLEKKYPDAGALIQSWKIRAEKISELLK